MGRGSKCRCTDCTIKQQIADKQCKRRVYIYVCVCVRVLQRLPKNKPKNKKVAVSLNAQRPVPLSDPRSRASHLICERKNTDAYVACFWRALVTAHHAAAAEPVLHPRLQSSKPFSWQTARHGGELKPPMLAVSRNRVMQPMGVMVLAVRLMMAVLMAARRLRHIWGLTAPLWRCCASAWARTANRRCKRRSAFF